MFNSVLSPNLVGIEKITLTKNDLGSLPFHLKSGKESQAVLHYGE